MPYKQGDRIFETGDCAGTGDVFVQGAFNGLFKPFLSILLDGDTTTILIESTVASEAEVCDATWQAASGRLVRGSVLWSTQPDNGRVPFLVGTKRVMMTESIQRVVRLDPTGLATIPLLTVTTTALMPAPAANDDSARAATTAWVRANLGTALTPYATTAYVDAANALKAPLASPAFTGNPTAPTPAPGDSDTSIATTAFIAAAIAALNVGQYAPLASPTLTGDPKAPTPVTTDNDTSIATTAFVRAAIASFSPPPDLSPYALIASPTFTGDPKAPTPATGDNDTSIATSAFVKAQGYLLPAALTPYAPLASPALTGNPTAPTPTAGDNDTSIATTAFVSAAISANPSGAHIGTTPPAGAVAGRLWWYSDGSSGGGQMFVYYDDGNTTQWVPAAPPLIPSMVGAAARFSRSANYASGNTGGAWLKVAIDTTEFNDGAGTLVSNEWTPGAGTWHLSGSLGLQSAAGASQQQFAVSIYKTTPNGLLATAYTFAYPALVMSGNPSCVVKLSASDKVGLSYYVAGADPGNYTILQGYATFLSGYRIAA